MTVIFSRNHQRRRPRLPPSFMLMRRGFVRCNFIGHHGWDGQESINQPRSFCRHVHLHMMSCLSVLMLTWCAGKFEILTRDGCSMPATRCHKVSLVYMQCMRVSQIIVRSSALQEFTLYNALSLGSQVKMSFSIEPLCPKL